MKNQKLIWQSFLQAARRCPDVLDSRLAGFSNLFDFCGNSDSKIIKIWRK